jgi:hypothetical protein
MYCTDLYIHVCTHTHTHTYTYTYIHGYIYIYVYTCIYIYLYIYIYIYIYIHIHVYVQMPLLLVGTKIDLSLATLQRYPTKNGATNFHFISEEEQKERGERLNVTINVSVIQIYLCILLSSFLVISNIYLTIGTNFS